MLGLSGASLLPAPGLYMDAAEVLGVPKEDLSPMPDWSAWVMPLPVMLKRLLNLLRVLASVLMFFSYIGTCTFDCGGYFTLEPSSRACTGIYLEVVTFFADEVVVLDSLALP